MLAISAQPPEVMAPVCELSMEALSAFSAEITVTSLIVDPAGGGRPLSYELWACASPGDRTCEEDRVVLAQGETAAGELSLAVRPGIAQLLDETPLLQRVLEEDSYQGLGGLRMPLVLRLSAGGETLHASKLLVFSCPFFPEMTPNTNPELQGLSYADVPWAEGEELLLEGPGPHRFTPGDFSHLEEAYVVPSFELERFQLEESWKLSWHADQGSFSPYTTGGDSVFAGPGQHRARWEPSPETVAGPVRFWVVARDGRGGISWLTRTARYQP